MDTPDTQARFRELIAQVTGHIAGRKLDVELETELNRWAAPETEVFQKLSDACRQAVSEGWMCNREGGGIRFGRVIKPNAGLGGFSVDVVEMARITGPHHLHPNGEIDLVMPLDGEARFDGQSAGWKVYEPGSAHYPTVTGGRALVLYLLPQGAIQFTPGPEDTH